MSTGSQHTMTAAELLALSTERRSAELGERGRQLQALRARVKAGDGRRIREAARITQLEMAATVGVSRALLSHWENGIREPAGDAALRYADLLDVLEAAATEAVEDGATPHGVIPDAYLGCEPFAEHGACFCSTGVHGTCTQDRGDS